GWIWRRASCGAGPARQGRDKHESLSENACMAAPLPPPRLLPSGDSAMTVEFARNIDDAANQRVLALDRAMAAAPIDGVTETVPTYRSLLVHYDPKRLDFDGLGEKVLALAQAPAPPSGKVRRWRVPV